MKLGVVHLWHFMSADMNTVLKEAIKGPFAKCDGLVLDVRGRGGRSDVIGQVMGNFQGRKPIWTKPVVVLQDHGTRSAKEIFAWSWKQKHLGKIVGEKTLGAVIGCQFKKLFDGSVLMYPAQDVRPMTHGEQLEGHGIDPDVAVEVGDLRWRNGKDPIIEKGVSVLLDEIKEFRVASRWF
jgi:carboxyl-terminal processing protease